MKNLAILFMVLFFSASIFSQNVLTAFLSAGDTATTPIRIPSGEIPAAIFCDSLSAAATISFYIYVGDTTGATDLTDWYAITTVGTSTNSTVSFAQKKYTPLNKEIFYAAFSSMYASGNKAQQVWMILEFAATQTNNKRIFIRTVKP